MPGKADEPSFLTRVASRLKGEVRADTLESFRRAGGVAYGEIHAAEELRRRLAAENADLWTLPPGTASQLLCAWNAFVLQSIGEHLLDADYTADPRTAGYVPAVTHAQVIACFDRVEEWTSRARQAAGNPALDVRDVAALPDDLPEWAEGLLEADAEPALHEAVETRLQRALETYYHLGQLVAMPALIAAYANEGLGMSPVLDLPALDSSAFDQWCLTSPRERQHWRNDLRARRAVEELWKHDPDPRRTLRVQAEIDAAFEAGLIDYARGNGTYLGAHYACPWGAVYVVLRAVTIDGRRLPAGRQFTFEVSAEAVPRGGRFVRRLSVGSFTPTREIGYSGGPRR
ncbi:hypothetical protein [Actinomadura atramentaria]|uniref:hypothetical protein n=1 Tax=Actinomadura atramentaria TaxID=1990 RepID=UPI00037295BF|nr:hypothetical protein [Actinomadura atramentaria]